GDSCALIFGPDYLWDWARLLRSVCIASGCGNRSAKSTGTLRVFFTKSNKKTGPASPTCLGRDMPINGATIAHLFSNEGDWCLATAVIYVCTSSIRTSVSVMGSFCGV